MSTETSLWRWQCNEGRDLLGCVIQERKEAKPSRSTKGSYQAVGQLGLKQRGDFKGRGGICLKYGRKTKLGENEEKATNCCHV